MTSLVSSLADTVIGVAVFGGMIALVVIVIWALKHPPKPDVSKVKVYAYKLNAGDTTDPRTPCPHGGAEPSEGLFVPYRLTWGSIAAHVWCSGCGYHASFPYDRPFYESADRESLVHPIRPQDIVPAERPQDAPHS